MLSIFVAGRFVVISACVLGQEIFIFLKPMRSRMFRVAASCRLFLKQNHEVPGLVFEGLAFC